jgi:DNA-directed RNA polymerase subunit RPC12/RpoP
MFYWNAETKKENKMTQKTRCPGCGLKIRGKNHSKGEQHIKRAAKKGFLVALATRMR